MQTNKHWGRTFMQICRHFDFIFASSNPAPGASMQCNANWTITQCVCLSVTFFDNIRQASKDSQGAMGAPYFWQKRSHPSSSCTTCQSETDVFKTQLMWCWHKRLCLCCDIDTGSAFSQRLTRSNPFAECFGYIIIYTTRTNKPTFFPDWPSSYNECQVYWMFLGVEKAC